MAATNQYRPDYAVPPGWILEERLEVQGISQAEFARLCGCSSKLISEIVSGKVPLEPETARQFEKILGVDASIWLGIEDAYKSHRPQEAERHLVFISHANPEDNEFASWLGTRLTAAGYEAWTDVLNLKGGEPFWRDIGTVIKEEAAVVIVALSHASYQKDGVLDEIALAVNTGRQLNKQQFVIPIRLDDLPFSDFPEQLIRLNAIDFSHNWADGFSQLLQALKDSQIPQSTSDFGEALAAWQKFKLRQSASISDTPDSVFSNWFQISSLPSHIYFSRFNASQEAMERAFNEFQSPTAPYMRLAVSFADAAALQMETPDIPLEDAYRVSLVQFLDDQKTNRPQVSWRDARNIVTRLLRQAWEQFARSQGLLLCEFAHGSAWFVPLDLIERNIATFQDESGNKRRRRLVGRSKKRGVYWHFAVSGKVNISNPQYLLLRTHVVFTKDGKTPLDSQSRADRLRKSFCKNWWNDRWRDLLRALVSTLANGKEELSLSLGGDAVATIAASPMDFEAPLSITESGSVSTVEEDNVEDETEADALDDFDSDLDETDFDDLLDHEDDEYEEAV
jgi:plasmid maintenance system antidote protein VapI